MAKDCVVEEKSTVYMVDGCGVEGGKRRNVRSKRRNVRSKRRTGTDNNMNRASTRTWSEERVEWESHQTIIVASSEGATKMWTRNTTSRAVLQGQVWNATETHAHSGHGIALAVEAHVKRRRTQVKREREREQVRARTGHCQAGKPEEEKERERAKVGHLAKAKVGKVFS